MRRLFTGRVPTVAKWKLRTQQTVKLVAAAVFALVFIFGFYSQKTKVGSPPPVVLLLTTAAPVQTTVAQPPPTTVPLTTTSSTTTLLEPWITTTSTTTVMRLTSHEPRTTLEKLICDERWEWNCEEAIAVATCESSMRPSAVSPPNRNGTIDRGLFQINDVWREAWPPEVWSQIFDARTNIAMAHHAWKVGKRSWMYWTCQP